MSERPKLVFTNPNFSLSSEMAERQVSGTGLHALDASEKIYQRMIETEKESLVDAPTGCFNRRFYEKFKSEHFDPNRDSGRIGLVFIDINNMKQINDDFGHDVGDATIKASADYIKKNCRKDDLLVRYGGDEFIIIHRGGSDYDVDTSEEKLSSIMLERLSGSLPVELAIGCAIFDKKRDTNLDDTQILADQRMYDHKREKYQSRL
jgi:diguanylate cyclase (GGDEF)-like protein